jgi:hypothetical protein
MKRKRNPEKPATRTAEGRRACFSGQAVFIAPGREAAKYGTRFRAEFSWPGFFAVIRKKMRPNSKTFPQF